MRSRIFLSLVVLPCIVAAQSPNEEWRMLQGTMHVDSVAGGRVHYKFIAHEDPARIGQAGSMTLADWNFHAFKTKGVPVIGDIVIGRRVWQAQCVECHTHKDAWDVREFNPPDSVKFRRAIVHVKDTTDTWHLIAYINSLKLFADTMTLHKIPFQPGGVVLRSDSAFGVQIVGPSDKWNLTRDSLLRINPQHLPIALALPEWSDEQTLNDWVPGTNQGSGGQLPQGVQAAVQSLLDRYDANPTDGNALAVASALQTQASNVKIPDAPCTFTAANIVRYQPIVCGQVGQWWSLFLYLHGVRFGRVAEFARVASSRWWEHGHLWHKAQQMSGQSCGVKCDIPNRSLLIAQWIYLGWMWDLALNKNSLYGGGPLDDLHMNRLATFSILRTMVARPTVGNPAYLACSDAENNAGFGFAGWLDGAQLLAYNEITRRELAGAIPAANKADCIENIRRAQVKVGQRAGAKVQQALQPAADAATAALRN